MQLKVVSIQRSAARSMLRDLKEAVPLATLHLPAEIAGIESLLALRPSLPQIACFDTAFHQTLPEVAYTYALPRTYREAGVRRYGFHGLSCEYIVEELTNQCGADVGPLVSAPASAVMVRAMLTNEELTIARHAAKFHAA